MIGTRIAIARGELKNIKILRIMKKLESVISFLRFVGIASLAAFVLLCAFEKQIKVATKAFRQAASGDYQGKDTVPGLRASR